jgi:hypothetical protein
MTDGNRNRRGGDPQLDAFSVDVHELLEGSVANLYSHLVTRPTGRAVRLAIEAQLHDLTPPALSMVDLSSVVVLDYSCADEVVAKLLLSSEPDPHDPFRGGSGACEAAGSGGLEADGSVSSTPSGSFFFIFQGLRPHHLEPIREVLHRHELAAVVRSADSPERFELLGVRSSVEEELWTVVETRGRMSAPQVSEAFRSRNERAALDGLVRRGLLFRHPLQGDLHSLGHLARRFE